MARHAAAVIRPRLDAARCRKAIRQPAPLEEVLGIGLTVGLITMILGWSVAVALYTLLSTN